MQSLIGFLPEPHLFSMMMVPLFALTGYLNRVSPLQKELRSLDNLAWWYEACAGITFALLIWVGAQWQPVGVFGGVLLLATACGLRDLVRRRMAGR